MSSREMSHFSAMSSAPLNWLISWSPYRAVQPFEPANGSGCPKSAADAPGRADRDHAHVLHAAGDDEVLGPAHHALRGEVQRLLRRTALAVQRHAGHLLRQSGGQPAGPGDVAGLRPDHVDAAEDDVLDLRRVDARTLDERLEHMRAQVSGVRLGQTTVAAADGGADCFDEIRLGHCEVS